MKSLSSKSASFLTSFPVPDYLSFRPTGIDISPKAVRVLALKQKKEGLLPDFYDEKILDEACPILQNDDDIKACVELRVALQELQEKHSITFATISLPEVKTYIFKTTLPQEALATVGDALTVKIQENVPLDTSQIVYDYLFPGSIHSNGEAEVIVTVFPRNVIAAYTKLLEEVGIIPIAFESESQSIARSVIEHEDTTPYLLMNLGYSRVNLAIIEHGIVSYTSSLSYSPEALIEDTNSGEAIELKRKINQLLVYWFTNKRDSNNEEKITTAILTGPYATNQKIMQYLEESAHIIVQPANIWKNCFSLDDYVPTISRDHSLHYATAVGLALITQ
jgi:Tfp pilus assembly PilM family ATPase